MTYKVYQCDLCEEEYDSDCDFEYIKATNMYSRHGFRAKTRHKIAICQNCQSRIKRFLKGESENKNGYKDV